MKVICIALSVSLAACSYASCAEFRWDICRIIRRGRRGSRIDAFERQHDQRYGRLTGP